MIVGNIFKGIKRIIEFKEPTDKQELATIQNNLLCRLSTMSEKEGKKAVETIKKIDRILN